MRKIILASHGALATGMKDTIKMITGADETIYAFGMSENQDPDFIHKEVEHLLDNADNSDHFFLFSDFPGGSVNTALMRFIDRENVQLISGMNVPMLLEFVLGDEAETVKLLEHAIEIGKNELKEIVKEKFIEDDIWED